MGEITTLYPTLFGKSPLKYHHFQICLSVSLSVPSYNFKTKWLNFMKLREIWGSHGSDCELTTFWDAISWYVVDVYWHFRGIWYLHHDTELPFHLPWWWRQHIVGTYLPNHITELSRSHFTLYLSSINHGDPSGRVV